jgi:hypothetical protein
MTVSSFPVATNATTAESLANSTNQYKALMLSSAGVTLAWTSRVYRPIGILQNSPTTAQVAAVCVDGVTQFRMGASTRAAGDTIAASSLGLGIIPSSDAWQIGQILYGSSGAAGRLVTIKLEAGSSAAPDAA